MNERLRKQAKYLFVLGVLQSNGSRTPSATIQHQFKFHLSLTDEYVRCTPLYKILVEKHNRH
jgi:hypothetical protein